MLNIGTVVSAVAAAPSLAAVLVLSSSTVVTAADRTPPTAPSNLRATAVRSYSVSLAWSPSSDNSGNFSYRVRHSWGYEVTVPQTQTTYTWTTNLEAGRSYYFVVYAIDAAGNRSRNSNTVNVRMASDRTPPTQPVVSVTDVGPTHVTLLLSTVEEGPAWFNVYKDGTAVMQGLSGNSATISLLTPQTSYTFTAQARDFAINWSPMSEPVVATTRASNPNDVVAPTTPGNLTSNAYCEEVGLRWTASTDDLDPQWVIRYDVYVNGKLDHSLSNNQTRTVVYGVAGANVFEVIALDTAGNASAPATLHETLTSCN
jgi:hypothetical protein